MRQKSILSENNRIRKNTYRICWSDRLAWIKPAGRPIGIAVCYASALVLLSAGLIFCHDFLIQNEYFNAAAIRVSGFKHLTEKEIIEIARLHDHVNILSVNTGIIKQRLQANPWIAEAKVRRQYPFALRIDIREHAPLAILDMGRKFLINEHGDVFKEWENSDPIRLPIVSGLDFTDISVQPELRSQHYQAAMDILSLGKKPEGILPNHMIQRIHIDKDIGAAVYPSRGVRTLKLGFHDFAEKYEDLKYILMNLNMTLTSTTAEHDMMAIDSIDLHNPNRIVITPTQPESFAGEYKEV